MTRRANSAVAGFTFLLYIALAYPAMSLSARASAGDGIPAKLATLAEHAADVRLSAVLFLLSSFCALILAVTLYRITCEEDADIAMLGMICRVAEGIAGGGLVPALGLMWLATTSRAGMADGASANTLAGFLFKVQDWDLIVASTFFAVGSTAFAYLFVRGRIIPAPLAWLGFLGSAVLATGLVLQLAGVVSASVINIMFIPLALFEIPLGFWLLIKGARAPEKLRATGVS
ncbi:MAG TPA: DUF4386 domain-containing protein [Gemmatimonadaceae bacterium]|nr:DUF4386 domain-containing protein [Gemmatimonadaceae bacterium]